MARKSLVAWVFATLLALGTSAAPAGTVYFRLSEWPGREEHHDSFVVPLDRPADIAHARDLIRLGPEEAGAAILFAQIAPGTDGINRDLAPGATAGPAWSWHVSRFLAFNDFGIELTDGWPTYVQDNLGAWLKNTNSRIGFWSYTVTAELPGPPTGPAAVPLPPALAACAAAVPLLAWGRRTNSTGRPTKRPSSRLPSTSQRCAGRKQ